MRCVYEPMVRFANERIHTEVNPKWQVSYATAESLTKDLVEMGLQVNGEQIVIIISYNGSVIDIFVNPKAETGSAFLVSVVKRVSIMCESFQKANLP